MIKAILFDWGNTLMVDNHDQIGPMSTWDKIVTVKKENDISSLEMS